MGKSLAVFWLLFLGNQGAVSFFPAAFTRRERASRAVSVEGASTIATEGSSGEMTDLASRVTQALQLHKDGSLHEAIAVYQSVLEEGVPPSRRMHAAAQ